MEPVRGHQPANTDTSHPADSTPIPEAALSRQTVFRELRADFGDKIGLEQKTLSSCNWKMGLGIAVGVLVGSAILLSILGALAGSKGTLVPVLGVISTKLTALTHLVAHVGHSHHHDFVRYMMKMISKIVSPCISALVFLGGGKIAGKLFQAGEVEQMDKLLQPANNGLGKLEGFNDISEAEIDQHISEQQSKVLSSQAGRNFLDAKRKSGLHYSGKSEVARKVVKAFGHFWGSVPSVSLKSIGDISQYRKFSESVERERDLKLCSAGDPGASPLATAAASTVEVSAAAGSTAEGSAPEALTPKKPENFLAELNELRGVQLDRFVLRNTAVGDVYTNVPEVQIYDRNITKLEILLKKTTDSGQIQQIENAIQMQKEKKLLLIDQRTAFLQTNERGYIFANELLIKRLDTFKEDIGRIEGISKEKKKEIESAIQEIVDREIADGMTAEQKEKELTNKLRECNLRVDTLLQKGSPLIQDMFSIKEGIWKIQNISEEQKGQILEAVTILLREHPGASILTINKLVKNVVGFFAQREGTSVEIAGTTLIIPGNNFPGFEDWHTRSLVCEYSKCFARVAANPDKKYDEAKVEDEVALKSKDSLGADISKIKGLSKSQKDQIYNGVMILNNKLRGFDVPASNYLLEGIKKIFDKDGPDVLNINGERVRIPKDEQAKDYNSEIEKVVDKYVDHFSKELLEQKDLNKRGDLALALNKRVFFRQAPMTTKGGMFLGLKILDIAISAIHMIPVPGTSLLAAAATFGAVKLEKKGG